MRHTGNRSRFMKFFVTLALFCVAASSFAEEKYIPALSHFTVATPGSHWLNVSRELKPEDLRNKIVLLDFWTYCCINCIHTMPEIAKLEKEFKDDLVVIGVHSAKFDNEKDTDQIRQAILRYEIGHPVVNDKDFRIWRTFDVRSWPTLILLQPNGEVVKKLSGEGNTEELRKEIKLLVKNHKNRTRSALPMKLEREKVAEGEFFYPSKLAYEESSKLLFVSDSSHHQIAAYSWDPKKPESLKPAFRIGKSGSAGNKDGSYTAARFRRPQGLVATKNFLYVADTENHTIRKVDLRSKTVSTVAGTGKQGVKKEGEGLPAKTTALASPWDVAFHPDGDHLVIAMAGTHQLWSLDLPAGKLSVIAGKGTESIDDGLETENSLSQPSGLSSLLGSLYFVDAETSSLRFYFESYVKTLVGTGLFDFGFKDGERKKAQLQHPLGLYADVTGVYIADSFNHSIRRYEPSKQMLETVIGDGKSGEGAGRGPEDAKTVRLNEPAGITKIAENTFVIADTNNHRLVLWNRITGKAERMKIEGEKMPETLAGAEAVKSVAVIADQKRFNVRLPNTLPMADAKVNRTNPEIKIILPERYKINAEAPSFLRLFEGAPPKAVFKQEWTREDLVQGSMLKVSELKGDMQYFLQGTIYYCLDTKNALCEIASVSFPVRVDPSGTEVLEVKFLSSGQ